MSEPRGRDVAATTRSTNDPQTWGVFLLLSVIWGSSYLFIKIGLDEGVPPLTLVSLRTVLGGLFLGAVMLLARGRLSRSARTWFDLSIVAMTNVVIPYALITWGELHISSAMAGILTALVPLSTVVLAAVVLRDERLTSIALAGIIVGFGGVVLLAWPSLTAATEGSDGALPLAGMAAVAGATVAYAIAVVYTRRTLTGSDLVRDADGRPRSMTALEISFGQVLIAAIVITVVAVALERPEGSLYALPGTTSALFAMLWLGVLGTGVAYLLYFALVVRWGATRTTLITYVMPIVAVVLGFLVLDERLEPIELVGTVLIIGGIGLVNARRGSSAVPAEATGATEAGS